MARWELKAKHYIRVVGTRWRYEETDRQTGEKNEVTYDVPRFLDPENPRDCRSGGLCIVAYAEGAQRGDWVFTGPPTPDMAPLDSEAKALSAEWAPKWSNPISDLPAQGDFGSGLLANLEKQLTAAFARAGESIGAVSVKGVAGVSVDDFTKLQEQVAALMGQNAELQDKLAKAPKPAGRRA